MVQLPLTLDSEMLQGTSICPSLLSYVMLYSLTLSDSTSRKAPRGTNNRPIAKKMPISPASVMVGCQLRSFCWLKGVSSGLRETNAAEPELPLLGLLMAGRKSGGRGGGAPGPVTNSG